MSGIFLLNQSITASLIRSLIASTFSMKRGCPNLKCNSHRLPDFVVKAGSFYRQEDSRSIQRYRCRCCGKYFSSATSKETWRQKKRRVNQPLMELLSSGVSMRRAARLLNIHQLTVARKVQFLATLARKQQDKMLLRMKKSVHHLQFDDLITTEHTKMKPLTVIIAVNALNRKILGCNVGRIPAFGHLAAKSRIKYGPRKSEHLETLNKLFTKVTPTLIEAALIESDQHHFYPDIVKKYLPLSVHKTYKGGRGCIVGQGELKKLGNDPLFAINHTCAMLRANINRLIRKTWCTTKKVERLQDHLDIFIAFHNNVLV